MRQAVNGVLRRHGLVLAFLVFLAGVALNADAFLTPGNILDVLRQVSITGMMALGVTFVVLTGRLDLSVGSLLTLLTVIVVDQHNVAGPFPAIVMTLGAGLIVGRFQWAARGLRRAERPDRDTGNAVFFARTCSVLLRRVQRQCPKRSGDMVRSFRTRRLPGSSGSGVPVSGWGGYCRVGPASHYFRPPDLWCRRQRDGQHLFRDRCPLDGVLDLRGLGVHHRSCGVIMGSRVMGAQNTIGQGYELTVLAGVILGGTSLWVDRAASGGR
jgi:ribose transport system permease protein